jgi:hypothetical protein
MTITRAFASIAASAAVCAAVGAVVGWGIGTFAPEAYRGLFAWGASAEFSPAEFGVGLGLAQGLIAGLFVGILVVAIVTWHDVRTSGVGGNLP